MRPILLLAFLPILQGSVVFPHFAPRAPRPDDLEEPQEISLVGEVAEILADGSGFVLKAKGKRIHVEWPRGDGGIFVHEVVNLKDVPEGESLSVLGREQESTRDPGTGVTVPPQIIQIGAVVVGEFEVPERTAAVKKKRLRWFQGKVRRKNRNHYVLQQLELQIGKERAVVQSKRGRRDSIEKKRKVCVTGVLEGAKKDLRLVPRQVIRLTRFPSKEYGLILGL